jgi:uncharacterized protein (TIGR03790 family)
MSAILSQSALASFPDRPDQGGISLDVAMSLGDQGAYLAHDLGAEQAVFHARFVFNPWGVIGGRVTVLAGLDSLNVESLRLTYDTGSRALSVWFPGGTTLSAVLDGVVAWQCVEVSVDTVAGQADLWINGVLADQANADLSASTIQTVWFGAVYKETGLVGSMFMDEVCFADSYIGPVIVVPKLTHAGEPARWLVVYNTADPDAASWVESYRQARGVPFANLLGLSLPLTEVIDAPQYASLVTAVDGYLSQNQLGGQVMGILSGYRVPGYVDFIGDGPLTTASALLQTSITGAGPVTNTNASPTSYERLTFDDLAGYRMTARIDGPDLAAANLLVSRSSSLMATGLSASDSSFYFDPFAGTNPTYQSAFTDMLSWATGLSGMRTRLNLILSGDPSGNAEAGFTSVSDDGLYWGWSSTLPDPNIFVAPAGRRALCGQIYLNGASATSVRSTLPGNWVDTPIAAGYAGVIASSRNSPVQWIPDTGALFDALRLGWTLAEAWHIAQPVLRGGFYLVGDPLMVISMPREGTEVFGPLSGVKNLDPSTPASVLPEGVSGVDLVNAIPADGAGGTYIVRRSDSSGRLEASTTLIRVVNVNGASHIPPMMPVWPDVTNWAVVVEDENTRLLVFWAGPLGSMRVGLVELLSQPEGGAEAVAAQPTFDPKDDYVRVIAPVPSVKSRYRWRITSPDGVVQHTSWSAFVEPPAAPSSALQQIGANS